MFDPVYQKEDLEYWSGVEEKREAKWKKIIELKKKGHDNIQIAVLMNHSERHIRRLYNQYLDFVSKGGILLD